jgi:pimeloyl-ACP methyl ester carboxylesterase
MTKSRRGRVPLAIAMGAGLTAVAVGTGIAATRRSAARHRMRPDARSDDGDVFDLAALGVTHHRIPSHDGGELHVVEKGPADGPPLLLLHGITLQARVWGYQLRDLSGHWRVVAVDLRGHGESRPGTEGFGLDRLARDLRTVLEALDLRGVVVVGHSMGGMTLMRFCADHPEVLADRVAGCVFLATAPVVPIPPGIQRVFQQLAPRLSRFGERGGWERLDSRQLTGRDLTYVLARRAFGRDASPLHVQLTADLVAAVPPSTTWPSGIGLLEHDAEEALARTHTPALVIGGELDNITPIALSRRIAEHLPQCELHVLPNAGHQLMLERPAEIADLLDAFEKRLAAT